MNSRQKGLRICLDRKDTRSVDTFKKKKISKWLIIISSVIVPGSGHVFSNRPIRGLLYVFWIFSMGYITWMLTSDSVHFILRFTGGLLVWIASVVEIAKNNDANKQNCPKV